MGALDQMLRELTRPAEQAGHPAVWRRSTVTAVQVSPPRVQTTLTGTAWVRYLKWWTPTVGAQVELMQQGPDLICLGELA